MPAPTKTIFCAKLQKDTVHTLTLSPINGEVIATCEESGEFIKFAAGIKKADFDQQIADYKTANEGQVSIEQAEENLQELADLADPEEN